MCEQLDETEWDNIRFPRPPYEIDRADGRSPTLAAQAAHLQPAWTFESHPGICDANLLDPALREQNTSRGPPPETQNMEMEDSIPDDMEDYPVECVLEKRGNMFYLQWKDGTRSWAASTPCVRRPCGHGGKGNNWRLTEQNQQR